MSNKLFRIKLIQPSFDELYKKYENSLSAERVSKSDSDTSKSQNKQNRKEASLLKIDHLISQIEILEKIKSFSAEHVRWVSATRKFLKDVFGEESEYLNTFSSLAWKARGGQIIGGPSRPAESHNPQLGIDRVNHEAYLKELDFARGLLLAARDDLEQMQLPDDESFRRAIIFPKRLLESCPPDVKEICDEFHYNFSSGKHWAAMLLLRRLLPLSIVRKFQSLGKEQDIQDVDGDYMDTKALLGKVEKYIKNKKLYKEILSYKVLTDSSQHSYTFSPELSDAEGAAIKIRLLLDDFFH